MKKALLSIVFLAASATAWPFNLGPNYRWDSVYFTVAPRSTQIVKNFSGCRSLNNLGHQQFWDSSTNWQLINESPVNVAFWCGNPVFIGGFQ